jgi:glutathione S-transferase
MLRAIEACVSEETTGCAVGTSLSLADLAIYSVIRDALPAYRDETVAAAQDCPSILEIVEAVENHPKIAAWLKARPESNF